jgi:hypothetical protein
MAGGGDRNRRAHVSTEGIEGFYVGTRDYAATATFWKSLGFKAVFESDHGSGQWEHPAGGPWVFIDGNPDGEPDVHPVLRVANSTTFAPDPAPEMVTPFTAEHWDAMQAMLRDPDGRLVSLQAPLPEGASAPDADAHHREKYGSR